MAIGPEFKDRIALGHFLDLQLAGTSGPTYTLQNFFVDAQVTFSGGTYGFAPFVFTGVTVNRNGDNQSTNIVIHNNTIIRALVTRMLSEQWIATVHTMLLDPGDTSNYTELSSYVGQLVAATVSGPTVEIELGSILDAVGSDVPRRRITEDTFGPLPTTASVRLQ